MATSANRQSFFINWKNSQMLQSPVDCIINHLLEERQRLAENNFLERDRFDDQRDFWLSSEIDQLCLACSDIFLKESSLLELKAPIKIAGDLHGEFNTLLSIFEHDGLPLLPPQSNYLFLGNYGDRAGYHFETVVLLLALKIKYPENIFLLKGSHDGAQSHLLIDECEMDRFPLFESVNNCLSYLPVAALINDKIICIHNGLSPYLNDLDQVRHINRPCRPKSGLLRDFIGSNSYMANVGRYAEVVNRLKPAGLRLICCDYKLAEWMSKSNSERTTKSESSPPGPEVNHSTIKPEDKTIEVCPQRSRTSTPAKYRSNYGSGIVGTESDQSKPRTNPATIDFDPTNPYRSKSPGVKRFLGARV